MPIGAFGVQEWLTFDNFASRGLFKELSLRDDRLGLRSFPNGNLHHAQASSTHANSFKPPGTTYERARSAKSVAPIDSEYGMGVTHVTVTLNLRLNPHLLSSASSTCSKSSTVNMSFSSFLSSFLPTVYADAPEEKEEKKDEKEESQPEQEEPAEAPEPAAEEEEEEEEPEDVRA